MTVSQREVGSFFSEFVFGLIANDIDGQITAARAGRPAGNFLCALALLCYTEVLGGVKRGTLARGEGSALVRVP